MKEPNERLRSSLRTIWASLGAGVLALLAWILLSELWNKPTTPSDARSDPDPAHSATPRETPSLDRADGRVAVTVGPSPVILRIRGQVVFPDGSAPRGLVARIVDAANGEIARATGESDGKWSCEVRDTPHAWSFQGNGAAPGRFDFDARVEKRTGEWRVPVVETRWATQLTIDVDASAIAEAMRAAGHEVLVVTVHRALDPILSPKPPLLRELVRLTEPMQVIERQLDDITPLRLHWITQEREHAPFQIGQAETQASDGTYATVTFRAAASQLLHGVVIDKHGHPLPGAQVRARLDPTRPNLETKTNVGPGGAFALMARGPEPVRTRVRLGDVTSDPVEALPSIPQRLALDTTGLVRFRVVDQNGRPIERFRLRHNAQVWPFADSRPALFHWQDGVATVPFTAFSTRARWFLSTDTGDCIVHVGPATPADAPATVVFRGHEAIGNLTIDAGDPARGGHLRLAAIEDVPRDQWRIEYEFRRGGDASWRITNLFPGRYTYDLSRVGSPRVTGEVEIDADTRLSL